MNAPRLTPAMEAGTRFGGMEGWVDLVDLIAPRPGVEPATFRSGVRRWSAAPPRYVSTVYLSCRPCWECAAVPTGQPRDHRQQSFWTTVSCFSQLRHQQASAAVHSPPTLNQGIAVSTVLCSDRRSLSLTLTLWSPTLTLPHLNLTIFPSIPCLVSGRRSEPIILAVN